jgi:hypothetical protein
MRFAARTDPHLQNFIKLARALSDRGCLPVFERRLHCALFNEPEFPDNQVFLLRPAKPKQLRAYDFGLGDRETAAALTEMKSLAEVGIPEEVANFRILPSGKYALIVCLVNTFGQRSAMKGIEYFHPKSSVTLRVRCLNLGSFVWCGSSRMIAPFYRYCLQTAPRHLHNPTAALAEPQRTENETPPPTSSTYRR